MQMAASDKKVIMQPLLEKHMDTKEDTEDTTVFVLKRCSDCSEKSVQMRQKNACSQITTG